MKVTPKNLYSAEQVRDLDRIAIEEYGIPGYSLMKRAGQVIFDFLSREYADYSKIYVFTGIGNNGGDGYVVAKLAILGGFDVEVVQIKPKNILSGDSLQAQEDFKKIKGKINNLDEMQEAENSLIVDALLGTGITRSVEGEFEQAIKKINSSKSPVISIDVPSGINSDTGYTMGCSVKADATVTFIGMKKGLLTSHATDCCGKLIFDSLNLPNEIYETYMKNNCESINLSQYKSFLGERKSDSHKKSYGHLVLIGGAAGMQGAILLSGMAALRTGAGLVTIATPDKTHLIEQLNYPELMVNTITDIKNLENILIKADVVAIGPGLGTSDTAASILSRILETDLPLIVDADALKLLAKDSSKRESWILTPHPGEAALLLDQKPSDIQQDRFESAKKIQKLYGGICILKGSGTIVASKQKLFICNQGNPGMATAGMGDVLTGIISALVCQRLSLDEAAKIGVCLHAEAGDLASKDGERGMIASDLFQCIRKLVN
ncbi:MAG: NAD(P)H-hydrate dehydratase [Pseudomonadota bacterium]